jgi:hypothetical protein
MPVTARLSKLFYERLGEAVTNELVDWFNQVDAAYKFDLKEINEANYARFDAKLEQRIAELRSELVTQFRTELAGVRKSIEVSSAALSTAIERGLKEQTRFFFVAWAMLLTSILALRFR